MLVGQERDSAELAKSCAPCGNPRRDCAIKCMYPRRIPSELVMSLSLAAYGGKIVLVDTDELADLALSDISKEVLLGFDTESKPSFKKGQSFPVSILQLGGSDCVWVFKLAGLSKSYEKIFAVLENPNIKKVGVAVKGDVNALRKLHEFTPAGFEDISEKTRSIGIVNTGLKNLAGLFLGRRISKSVQMSNWAAETLTQKQIMYAATDAWISRDLHIEVSKVLRAGRYALEPEEKPAAKPKGFIFRVFESLRGRFF